MKNFKVIAVLVLLVMTCFVSNLSSQVPNLKYKLINKGTAYEVSKGRGFKTKSLVIPAKYKGRPVTRIGRFAFYLCKSLISVKIPNSVTTIGHKAFSLCSGLPRVEIPNSVTIIGYGAFEGCYHLTSLKMSNSVTKIGSKAFDGCGRLTSIKIPNSATSIGSGAFSGCDSLTSVVIPNRITIIEARVFNHCSSLKNVKIPNSVTIIKENAFGYCKSLTKMKIPSSVTTIEEMAFYRCRSLTSINIPNSITTIGKAAFSGCTSLISVKIPNSISAIEQGTFYDCESLTSLEISNSVTSIGPYAFSSCKSLTSIKIPDKVTIIKNMVFRYCDRLTRIKIPNGVTSIGVHAFYMCKSLISVKIPNSVTAIGRGAFNDCNKLTALYVPKNSIARFKKLIIWRLHPKIVGYIGSNSTKSVTAAGVDTFRGADSFVRIKKTTGVTTALAKSTIYDQDRIKNNRIIKKYATKNNNYKKLLKISRDYNLLVGTRKFKIGKKARNQPWGYQGSYKWKFLTSKDDKKLDQYVKALANRWNKLPVGFIKKIGLKGVLFVKDLRFGGLKIGAGFGYDEMILFINVGSERTKIDTIEHLFLHELFHIMQIKYYTKSSFIDFSKWKKLNPANQTYYKGGVLAMIRNNQHKRNFFFADHPRKGFVNNYAWSDYWHDVTETFCYLMVTNLYYKATRWAKHDKIIAAKFKYLKKGLKNLYSGFDEGYFKRIHGLGK